jgi:hypothetical protein
LAVNDKEKTPPIVSLKYRRGDLIIKEGDYGISIYKIVKGKVRVFEESGGREIPLATLGRGEIIGEMTFLNRGEEPRTASARAIEDSELEVWHPSTLKKEYDEMPPVIKYIVNQALQRLVRMNQLVAQFTAKRQQGLGKAKQLEPGASRRFYYRKELDQECIYRPLRAPKTVRLPGRVKDISLNGVGLEVRSKNALNFSHEAGETFYVSMMLPTNKRLTFSAKIQSVRIERTLGRISMGMQFEEMDGENRKTLGFYMRS